MGLGFRVGVRNAAGPHPFCRARVGHVFRQMFGTHVLLRLVSRYLFFRTSPPSSRCCSSLACSWYYLLLAPLLQPGWCRCRGAVTVCCTPALDLWLLASRLRCRSYRTPPSCLALLHGGFARCCTYLRPGCRSHVPLPAASGISCALRFAAVGSGCRLRLLCASSRAILVAICFVSGGYGPQCW